jgi:soluble lytic murein transglycosylase
LQQLRIKSDPNQPGSRQHTTILRYSLPAAIAFIFVMGISALAPLSGVYAQLSTNLDPLNHKYPAQLQAALASFGKAVNEYASGRFASALASMPADTVAAATAIPDYIMFYKAKSYLDSGKSMDALEVLKTFQHLYPDSPAFMASAIAEAKALLALHDSTRALAALDNPQFKGNAEVMYLRGQALEEGNRKAEAIRMYLQVHADFVGSSSSEQAERRLQLLLPAFVTKPECRDALVRRGTNLIRAGRNAEARTLFLKLVAAPIPGRSAQEIYLLLADADTNMSRLTEALQYLRNVNGQAAGAQVNYLKGVCYRGLGNETAFLETRDRGVTEFPDSQFTERILYSVATYYDVASRVESARAAYEALARAFPKGVYAGRSLWRAATLYYAAGKYEAALRLFLQYMQTDPSLASASASAYWMGRCYEHLGHLDKSALCYHQTQTLANTSYYAMRARDALAALNLEPSSAPRTAVTTDFAQAMRQFESLRPVATALPPADSQTMRTMERARQLSAAGLADLALDEFQHAMADAGGSDQILSLGMARVFLSKADFLNVIVSMRRVFPDYNYLPPPFLPEEMWAMFFPTRHLDSVSKYAARNHLDPNLVLAVIRQESAFDESARSRSNARGLMQLLPATGRSLARQAGITQYSLAKLYEPDTNIALGARYLSERLQKYGGKVELALAAYNAGDNRVDRWLQEFGNVDMAEFVELIPFSETRLYVKQVMSNRAHYQLHSGGRPGQAAAVR